MHSSSLESLLQDNQFESLLSFQFTNPDQPIYLWNEILRVSMDESSLPLSMAAALREKCLDGLEGLLRKPLEETALVRLMEMAVRTGRAYHGVSEEKRDVLIGRAEEYEALLRQGGLLLGPRLQGRFETALAELCLLRLENDPRSFIKKAGDTLSTPEGQSLFLEGLIEKGMHKIAAGDYALVLDWTRAMLNWNTPLMQGLNKTRVICLLAEGLLGVGDLQGALNALSDCPLDSQPVRVIRVKCLLALQVSDEEIRRLCSPLKDTLVANLIAKARGVSLALSCIPDGDTLEIALLKVGLLLSGEGFSNVNAVNLILTPVRRWTAEGRRALLDLFQGYIERNLKSRDIMAWIELAGQVAANQEEAKPFTFLHVQSLLKQGLLDEAESRILNLPESDIQSGLLRVRLALARGRVSDAMAWVNRMKLMQGARADVLLDLLEESPALLRVHLLQIACEIESVASLKHSALTRALLAEIAQEGNELDLETRFGFFRAFNQEVSDKTLVSKVAWNLGQMATALEDFRLAQEAFLHCLKSMPHEAPFFYCQARFHDDQTVYTEDDLKYLDLIKIRDDLIGLFKAKALIGLSRWNDLKELTGASKSEQVITLVLGSNASIPPEIHLTCLECLLSDPGNLSPNLFRGLATCALLHDKPTALHYFRQIRALINESPSYPRDEVLWLCITSHNTALALRSYDAEAARAWCEVSISFLPCLQVEDRKAYETKVRDTYSKILTLIAK